MLYIWLLAILNISSYMVNFSFPEHKEEASRTKRLSRKARHVAKGTYAIEDEGDGSEDFEMEMSYSDRPPRGTKKRVPPLRIRVLGRGGEASGSSSPMFLAETVGEVLNMLSTYILIVCCSLYVH